MILKSPAQSAVRAIFFDTPLARQTLLGYFVLRVFHQRSGGAYAGFVLWITRS